MPRSASADSPGLALLGERPSVATLEHPVGRSGGGVDAASPGKDPFAEARALIARPAAGEPDVDPEAQRRDADLPPFVGGLLGFLGW
ncbi:MAG: hypothetical protein U0838_00140 [Chloroflexota bacterium]